MKILLTRKQIEEFDKAQANQIRRARIVKDKSTKKAEPKSQKIIKKPAKKIVPVPATLPVKIDIPRELSEEQSLVEYINRSKRLMKFVKDNLKEGIDYGPTWPGDSKKNIYISGCEKVCNWLKIVEKIFIDLDSFQMIGAPDNTVCYVDYGIRITDIPMVDRLIEKYGIDQEQFVYRMLAIAVGRGAATVNGTTVKDTNVAVKKGRIRGKKDMTLSLGLHNEFTQDVEDYGQGSEGEDSIDIETPKADKETKKKKKKKGEEKELPIKTLFDETLKTIRRFPAKLEGQRMKLEDRATNLYKTGNITALKAFYDSVARQERAFKIKDRG